MQWSMPVSTRCSVRTRPCNVLTIPSTPPALLYASTMCVRACECVSVSVSVSVSECVCVFVRAQAHVRALVGALLHDARLLEQVCDDRRAHEGTAYQRAARAARARTRLRRRKRVRERESAASVTEVVRVGL